MQWGQKPSRRLRLIRDRCSLAVNLAGAHLMDARAVVIPTLLAGGAQPRSSMLREVRHTIELAGFHMDMYITM